MIDRAGVRDIEAILRETAEREIMPRFCQLAESDITEKGPGDLVTVADRRAEEALTERLTALLPGSVVVGEEAVGDDPAVLDRLTGDVPVWVIDPIDGTHNFATDNRRFATLVALAHRGELLASWTYAPALDLMATALKGDGAYVEGVKVTVPPDPPALRHLDVAISHQKWWTPRHREHFNALSEHLMSLCFYDLASLEYVGMACGRRGAMVLTWEYAWDHAAGALLYAEAGGVVVGGDGRPFRVAGGNAMPFVAAPSMERAGELVAAMRPSRWSGGLSAPR